MTRKLAQTTINKFKKKLLADKKQLTEILERHQEERERIQADEEASKIERRAIIAADKKARAANVQAQLDADKAARDRRREKEMYLALALGGAKTMAGQSPYALANIGEGLGLQDYNIEFKSKPGKILEKVEKVENLHKITEEKIDKNLELTKEKKSNFKRKKFKKRKDFKKKN